MGKLKLKDMSLIALFAALTAVFSQIAIPLQPVPINLATLSVFLAGGILGAKKGTISQIVYILIGAIGLPVFSNFTGGVGVLIGPTGGYILGYVVATFVIGILKDKFKFPLIPIIIGLLCCYGLGTTWFMILTKNNLITALSLCVVPFLIGDCLKIIVASFLIKRISKVIK